MNSTELRKNIYKVLDRVIETGIPVPIDRKGRRLKIVLEDSGDKMKNLKKREGLNVDPEDLTDIKWDKEWKPSI